MNTEEVIHCPICDVEAQPVLAMREVRIGQRNVSVEDSFFRCPDCEEEIYLPGQLEALQRRAADKVRSEDGLLTAAQVKAVRNKLGLSQSDFERLLGVGPKTVVRWERGTVSQNGSTDSLMRVLNEVPESAVFLSTLHSVPLSNTQDGMTVEDASPQPVVKIQVPVAAPGAEIIDIAPYLKSNKQIKKISLPKVALWEGIG